MALASLDISATTYVALTVGAVAIVFTILEVVQLYHGMELYSADDINRN